VSEHSPIQGYELLKVLARNLHVVYLARQSSTGRLVCLRVGIAEKLRQQAESLATLDHPNIVRLVEAGELQGCGFFSALEYVEGGTLRERLRGGPLAPSAAAAIASTLALTLDYARGQDMIHQNLTPSSVFLKRDDDPILDDFRPAECSKHPGGEQLGALILGTPSYMAPEEATLDHHTDLGPSVDVYRLGGVLYQMLTGQAPFPFRESSPLQILEQVRTQEPLPVRRLQPEVPNDLETICMKCLEKQPSRRYRSPGELADDLARFLQRKPSWQNRRDPPLD